MPNQVTLGGELLSDIVASEICCPAHGWTSRCTVGSCKGA